MRIQNIGHLIDRNAMCHLLYLLGAKTIFPPFPKILSEMAVKEKGQPPCLVVSALDSVSTAMKKTG